MEPVPFQLQERYSELNDFLTPKTSFSESQILDLFNGVLEKGDREEWSDLDLVSQYRPFAHAPRGIGPISNHKLSVEMVYQVIQTLWKARGSQGGLWERSSVLPPMDRWGTEVLDFSCGLKSLRVRVHAYPCYTGLGVSLRILPSKPKLMENLGFPVDVVVEIKKLLLRRNGFGLVTGPTGSGKSTTLAAMVNYCRSMGKKVVTLEDPIEFAYDDDGGGLVVQKELESHFESFSDGLKSALRESPDVILVQEIRDRECADVAMEAARTGHLILATTHSKGTSGTIRRMLEMYPESEWAGLLSALSSSLAFIASQALAPRLDGAGRTLIPSFFKNSPEYRPIVGRFLSSPRELQELLLRPGQLAFSRSLESARNRALIHDDTARELTIEE